MAELRLKVQRPCSCGGKKRRHKPCKGTGWLDGAMSLGDVIELVVDVLRKNYPIIGRFLRKKKKRR